jgi:hypothetical protein
VPPSKGKDEGQKWVQEKGRRDKVKRIKTENERKLGSRGYFHVSTIVETSKGQRLLAS